MKIGIIGCESISHASAKEFARQYLAQMRLKHQRLTVVTVKEDVLGRHIRLNARPLNIRRKTVSKANHADQSNASELALGQLMWKCDELVIFDDGHVGLPTIAQEIGQRMNKVMHVVDINEE